MIRSKILYNFLCFKNQYCLSGGRASMEQEFSVEQGFAISLIFFLDLWVLVEPHTSLLDENTSFTHGLFFCSVCTGFETSAEWNEAVFRAKRVSKEKQKTLKLNNEDLFLCAIEFAKLHNERWKSAIDYTVHLLSSMQKNPKNYQEEWAIWEKAKNDFMNKRVTFSNFDWSADLP